MSRFYVVNFLVLFERFYIYWSGATRGHMSPIAISSYKPAIVIVTSYVIMTPRAYGALGPRGPRSHYDVILIVTSFATELATPTVTDVRTYGHLTAFNREPVNSSHGQLVTP